ncbi:MAG TPA: hypothetical protein VN759_06315 [Pseudolysinimonas sp.]|nr:hypothetical protein [Pseudolysinimonas sp.]
MADVDEDRIARDYTAPFYLAYRELSDPSSGKVAELVAKARTASIDEILWMLGTEAWRQHRVGGWFALVRPEPAVVAALPGSIGVGNPFHSGPVLAVSAALLCGADAISAIREVSRRAAEYGGDPAFYAPLVGWLEGGAKPAAGDGGWASVGAFIELAERIRAEATRERAEV